MKRLSLAGLIGLAPLAAAAQMPHPGLARVPEPVAVTATRGLEVNLATLRDAIVITRAQLDALGPASLAEVLQRLAGVEVREAGGPGQPAGIAMRGAGPVQILVLVDGLRIGPAGSATAAIESIPVEMIERIEVVKGAMSSLYGSGAMGGVVQVFTRGKTVPHLFATAGYGTDNDRRASFGIATADADTRASISLGARKVDAASATSARAPSGIHDADGDPHENAFATIRVSQRMWQGETVTLEGFGTRSRTAFDGGDREDRSDRKVLGGRVTSSTMLRPGWATHLSLGHARDELAFRGSTDSRFETRLDQVAWTNELKTANGSLVVGLEGLRESAFPEADEAGAPLLLDSAREVRSAFASVNETWRGQRLEASIRRDDDDRFGARNTSAVSFGGKLAQGGTRLAVTLARGLRTPTLEDLYATLPGRAPNPGLRPERSRGLEVSLRGDWGPITRWRLTAFDNRFEDLIAFSPAAGSALNVGRARVRGVEADLEARWLTLAWRANVTLQRPRDEETGARLRGRARHFGTLDATRSWGRWTAGMSLVASGDRFDSDNAAPASRLAGHARVDARVRYDLSKLWKAQLALVNLADRRYETALGYDAPRRGVMLGVQLEAF